MLETQEQYNSDKLKEAEWNKLFEQIIQYSPFGKWYQYMIGASNALTKRLPKRIAVDNQTGKPYVQYKGEMSKFAGVFATATHKAIAKDLSEKKWGNALGDLLGGGQIKDLIIQHKKKGVTVYNLSPEDVSLLWAKKVAPTLPPVEKAKVEAQIIIQEAKQKNKKNSFLKTLLLKIFHKNK